MPEKAKLQDWIDQRTEEDDDLYQRYARKLEPQHTGEFAAISHDGQLIVGKDELAVAKQAVERFGPGSFALGRIGEEAEIRGVCSHHCASLSVPAGPVSTRRTGEHRMGAGRYRI